LEEFKRRTEINQTNIHRQQLAGVHQ
jgi:hypothetical protein